MSKKCPTCSNRKESFFADGTICPTCGRRASLFLDDIEYSSGVRFDEIESLKTALRIKTEEHDCCAEDNITLRKQLAACKELLDEAENDKLENYRRLTESRRGHAAVTKERDDWRNEFKAEYKRGVEQLAACVKERDKYIALLKMAKEALFKGVVEGKSNTFEAQDVLAALEKEGL